MKKEDLKYFKDLLEKKRAEVLKNIEYLRRVALDNTNQEASGDHSAYSFHMADQGKQPKLTSDRSRYCLHPGCGHHAVGPLPFLLSEALFYNCKSLRH